MRHLFLIILFILLSISLLLLDLRVIDAAMPLAGSEILNQAVIKYKDENGVSHTSTTNIVSLVIRQVFSAEISEDRNLYGAADKFVTFYHTLRNTGNGTDIYCIEVQNATGDSGDFITLYAVEDLNRNGEYDNGEPILATHDTGASEKISIEAEDSVNILVTGKIPVSAAVGNTYKSFLKVKAQEGTGACQDGNVTDITSGKGADGLDNTNQDTAAVTNNAVIIVTKSSEYVNNGAGIADDTIKYTVKLYNQGLQSASDVSVIDDLPNQTAYKAGSLTSTGTWGILPAHNDGSPGIITGVVSNLVNEGNMSFSYEIDLDDNITGGTKIYNKASAHGNLDGNGGTTEPLVLSNETLDKIPLSTGVIISDTGVGGLIGINDGGDDDNIQDDNQTVDVAFQGETILFKHIITNTGNSIDTFNLKADSVSFPSGTVFAFLNETGDIRLLDTSSDGFVDTGPVDVNTSITIMTAAYLPAASSGIGPYSSVITASSAKDITVSDTTKETLGAITLFKVDLANESNATGYNDGGIIDANPKTSVTTIINTVQGGEAIFNLFTANEGSGRDSYALSAWSDDGCTTPLPPGWRVIFKDTAGKIISQTPGIDKGGSFAFTASVFVPPIALPGTTSIFFKVYSESSQAADIKQDAVIIPAEERISLAADQTGSTAPGMAIEYIHILKNTGTGTEDVKVFVKSQSLLNNTLFFPTNFNGTEPDKYTNLSALYVGNTVAVYDEAAQNWRNSPLVTNGEGGVAINLKPNESIRVKVKVIAPTSAAFGANDVLVLKAQVMVGTASVENTDQTIVSKTSLSISKKGAVDADCNSVPDTAFSTGNLQAQPGQCVIWSLLLVNMDVEPICSVKVYDTAPSFTSLYGAPLIFSQPAPGTGACVVAVPDFSCTAGNSIDINKDNVKETFCLLPSETAEIRFRVKLN